MAVVAAVVAAEVVVVVVTDGLLRNWMRLLIDMAGVQLAGMQPLVMTVVVVEAAATFGDLLMEVVEVGTSENVSVMILTAVAVDAMASVEVEVEVEVEEDTSCLCSGL